MVWDTFEKLEDAERSHMAHSDRMKLRRRLAHELNTANDLSLCMQLVGSCSRRKSMETVVKVTSRWIDVLDAAECGKIV